MQQQRQRTTKHKSYIQYKLQSAEEQDKQGSTMSLMVTVLVLTLVSQCWGAPQRRNWTPQAILYLKGAQGHRSVLERTSRGEGDTFHLTESVSHNQSRDGPGLSWSSYILELLQRAVEEGGGSPDNYSDEEELNLNYF